MHVAFSYCCFRRSVNEVVCHGIPDSRKLQEGDVVNLDVTVYYKGYHGDLNETFFVGKVSEESVRLVQCAYEGLRNAIAKRRSIRHGFPVVKPNMNVHDIGTFVSDVVDEYGFFVDRNYCGHGIGKLFHCNPTIPHTRSRHGGLG